VNEAALDGYRVRALVPEGTSSALQRHLTAEAGATVILERVANPLAHFQGLSLFVHLLEKQIEPSIAFCGAENCCGGISNAFGRC